MTYQSSRETFYFKIPVFITDLIIYLSILWLLIQVLPQITTEDIRNSSFDLGPYALLCVSFSIAASHVGIKLHNRHIQPFVVFWRAVKQVIFTYLLFTVLITIFYKAVPRYVIFGGALSSIAVISTWHYIMNKLVRLFRHMGHNTRYVVIIGADANAISLYKELYFGQSFTGYKILGFFSSLPNVKLPEGAKLLGNVKEFFDWITTHNADEVYCSLPPKDCAKEVNEIIKICNDHFIDFTFVPTMDGYPNRHMNVERLGDVTLIRLREEPLNNIFATIYKRAFDIVISSIFLCTLYPFVVLFVWIGTTLSSPGPLYFRQKRTGYNGKDFMIYKFRSMKVNADADKLQATKDDPRKTKFGDFLRKSSIDELPQFINVFLGDMSIIGPRPHMEHHTEVYSELIGDYMVRHLAKPGITGWAQINGCRGETKTVEEMENRVRHDIWYIEHWTPLLDIEIFFRTFWSTIAGNDEQAY